jgi:hypothetical protein
LTTDPGLSSKLGDKKTVDFTLSSVFTIEPEHDVSNNRRSIANEITKFPDTKHMLLIW